jgi:uncharacterized protein YcaQ
MADTISLRQARRIALAAQGFLDPRPSGVPTMRHLRRVVARTQLLQVDSVNVLQRAHYMPLFSRLGPYPMELVDRAAAKPPRVLFEYWGHEASLIPVELQPYFRWRMAESREEAWGGMLRIAKERPEFVDWVREEVAAKGPVTAAQIEEDIPRRPKEQWGWNWSDTKRALELLFWGGEITSSRRNGSFARVYDLSERVLPQAVTQTPTPARADAIRELVRRSAEAMGVAADIELRDYFRLPSADFKIALAELVEAGELLPVTVQGWKPKAYLHPAARMPRAVRAATVLSPFDPLIWERQRTERLFDFHYRIEIYTPAEKRIYGYYVLPFLLGEAIAARVDLKADRKAGVLQVPGAFLEPGHSAGEVAEALATALWELAGWLGLDAVAPPVAGDLASALTKALRPSRPPAPRRPAASAAVPE